MNSTSVMDTNTTNLHVAKMSNLHNTVYAYCSNQTAR